MIISLALRCGNSLDRHLPAWSVKSTCQRTRLEGGGRLRIVAMISLRGRKIPEQL